MKTLSRLCFGLYLISPVDFAAAEGCGRFEPADRYTLRQVYFTYGTDFAVSAGPTPVGRIVQRKFHLGRTFELLDARGSLVARAERRVISWGTQIDIYDCHHVKIGSIGEHVLGSMLRPYTVYSIHDAKGARVAQSTKIEWIRTSIDFSDERGHPQGRLARDVVNIVRDTWRAEFRPGSLIDRRLLLFAAAYRTADNADRAADEEPPGPKN